METKGIFLLKRKYISIIHLLVYLFMSQWYKELGSGGRDLMEVWIILAVLVILALIFWGASSSRKGKRHHSDSSYTNDYDNDSSDGESDAGDSGGD